MLARACFWSSHWNKDRLFKVQKNEMDGREPKIHPPPKKKGRIKKEMAVVVSSKRNGGNGIRLWRWLIADDLLWMNLSAKRFPPLRLRSFFLRSISYECHRQSSARICFGPQPTGSVFHSHCTLAAAIDPTRYLPPPWIVNQKRARVRQVSD